MARREAVERFGVDAYNDGYRVYTTVDSRHQAAAQTAMVDGLLTYDRRHGYRGPEARLEELTTDGDYSPWLNTLRSTPRFGDLDVGAVTAVDEQSAEYCPPMVRLLPLAGSKAFPKRVATSMKMLAAPPRRPPPTWWPLGI